MHHTYGAVIVFLKPHSCIHSKRAHVAIRQSTTDGFAKSSQVGSALMLKFGAKSLLMYISSGTSAIEACYVMPQPCSAIWTASEESSAVGLGGGAKADPPVHELPCRQAEPLGALLG